MNEEKQSNKILHNISKSKNNNYNHRNDNNNIRKGKLEADFSFYVFIFCHYGMLICQKKSKKKISCVVLILHPHAENRKILKKRKIESVSAKLEPSKVS